MSTIDLSGQNNIDFISSAYEMILGRAPDESGLESYLNRLDNGAPRFRIILDLICSPEAKFRGFDVTEIEDIITFYMNAKNNLLRYDIDRQISKKYADRIFNFFYGLRLKRKSSDLRISSAPRSIKQSCATSIAKSVGKSSYRETREQAQAILEKLYRNRRINPRNSLVDETLGIHVPQWAGVTNSTKYFFPHTFPIPLTSKQAPEHLNEEEIQAIGEALIESNFSQLIFSAGDYVQYRIARAVKESAPRKRIKILWHGSPRQLGPHYELDPFVAWVSAARSGICDAVGTVKPGMTSLFKALGIRTHFLQNAVAADPSLMGNQARPERVGMWLSHVGNYNKPVAPTLFALARLRHLSLQGSGFGEDGIQLIQSLGIQHKSISSSTVQHTRVLEGMRSSKLTIYITLSECMPMVPFESIGEGAPCLVGPATRLYDDSFLVDHLMVRNPFDPIEISKKIERSIEHYDELLQASADFLLRCKERSAQDLIEFLA